MPRKPPPGRTNLNIRLDVALKDAIARKAAQHYMTAPMFARLLLTNVVAGEITASGTPSLSLPPSRPRVRQAA